MHKLTLTSIVSTTAFVAAMAFYTNPAQATEVTLYKNPQCGCCEEYANYLGEHGYKVTVKPTHDLVAMSRQAGISDQFQGCHLAQIDGYVVSGHVPVGIVNRLLTERPKINGITLPGMPMGSPGMSGTKSGPFKVMTVSPAGTITDVYATE